MQSATPEKFLSPVWPLSISLATTLEISVDFFSSPYLDVSVQAVSLIYLFDSAYDTWTWLHVDCSIRKSADQSVLTTPRSLSQLITSFFGSQCQGIRPALFLALPFVSCSEFSWIVNSILVVFYPIIIFIIVLTRSILICITFTLFDFQASFCSWEQISINNSLFTEIYFQFWWAQMDSNHRPHAYQACALTTWAMRPLWWRWGGSNSWPPACKAGALPAELHPHALRIRFRFSEFPFQGPQN